VASDDPTTCPPCPDCVGHVGFRDAESAEKCGTCGGDGVVCPHCGSGLCAKTGESGELLCGFTGKPLPDPTATSELAAGCTYRPILERAAAALSNGADQFLASIGMTDVEVVTCVISRRCGCVLTVASEPTVALEAAAHLKQTAELALAGGGTPVGTVATPRRDH